MTRKSNFLRINIFVLIMAVLLFVAGCKVSETTTEEPPAPPPSGPTPETLFAGSGHADESAESFRHWDEDDPPVVPSFCARCHTPTGLDDYLADGVMDNAHDPGTLGCGTCHSDLAEATDSVTFPSALVIGGLGSEAVCMQCHQGRYSQPSVDAYITARGPLTGDVVNPALSFRNIHYFPAAATLYGTHAKGGYQYPGMMYDGRFGHVGGYDKCTTCHNPHSLELKIEECTTCHPGAAAGSGVTLAGEGLKNIRDKGSYVDYDGDGDTGEGIYWEIVTFQEYLYNAMWGYSKDVCGIPIVYDAYSYPYFFKDNNENGIADPEEANYGNQYRLYTPRLLKAAYNYQVSAKDPGGFAHGGKYIIQLLYDSVMSINGAAPNPIPLPGLARGDEGHFNGSTEAWRHWDDDGAVPGRCAKCHGYNGLNDFIAMGENVETPVANGMLCTNCHSGVPATRDNILTQDFVKFPSGKELTMGDNSNICLNCHQGRASKQTVDNLIASKPGGPHYFTNIHYFPTAAVLFGTEAQGGYEFGGKSYVGRKMFSNHGDNYDTCIECHMGTQSAEYAIAHNVTKPNPADCVICHGKDVSQPYPGFDPDKFKFSAIRPGGVPDYDGDGNVTESLKYEIKGLETTLYYYIQMYGNSMGKPIIYDSHAYPYFFNDKNGNGISDPGEAIYPNRYTFDDKLLRAAYNYQTSKKEPHGFIHNPMYIAQLLVDSIESLGGNIAPYTWR